MNYRIDVDTTKARQDHEFLFNDLAVTLTGRKAAVDFLWKDVDWDLFIVVVTGTDRLMHFLWEACEDEAHPHHRDFLDYFFKVDSFVGYVYERFLELNGSKDGMNQFFMLSDHGFTGIKTEVYLNRWLQENNYLKFGKERPDTIMDIGPGSAAFALDPSRIHINLKGKYPLGTIDLKDYDRVREEVKQGLESLTFKNSQRVVKKVYRKEELYHGAYLDRAPDMVVLANEGYDLKGKVNSATVFGLTNLMGMHSMDDAFFFSSSSVQCQSIFDAKGIILTGLQ